MFDVILFLFISAIFLFLTWIYLLHLGDKGRLVLPYLTPGTKSVIFKYFSTMYLDLNSYDPLPIITSFLCCDAQAHHLATSYTCLYERVYMIDMGLRAQQLTRDIRFTLSTIPRNVIYSASTNSIFRSRGCVRQR